MIELFHPGVSTTSTVEGLPIPTLSGKERLARMVSVTLGREPSWSWIRDFSILLILLCQRSAAKNKNSQQTLFVKDGKIYSPREQINSSFANDPDALRIIAFIAPEVSEGVKTYFPIIADMMPETLDEAISSFGEKSTSYRMVALADKDTREIIDRVIMVITLPETHPYDNRIVDANTHQSITMKQANRLEHIFHTSFDLLNR